MPPSTTKSGLLAKLGAEGRKAFEEAKVAETTYSTNAEPPAGIRNGLAQLTSCKFDQHKDGDNKGEYFFYAAGIIVEPKEFGGMKCAGLRTSIMEPLYPTPKRKRATVQDHVDWILNEFRKLGVDTADLEFDQLESVAAALEESKPHFNFRTWSGPPSTDYPVPRVNSDWLGVAEAVEEVADEIVDATGSADAFNEFEEAPEGEAEPTPEDETDGESEENDDNQFDLAALLDGIDDNEEAQQTLTDKAQALGIPLKQIESAPSWKAVGNMIEAKLPQGEGEAEPEFEPKKKEVYLFIPDPKKLGKNKKPIRVEIELTAVDAKKKTVAGRSVDDPKKTFASIPWDALIPTE